MSDIDLEICEERADLLEDLARDAEPWRAEALRQLAAYWRAVGKIKDRRLEAVDG
jgi:hypothetical protein